MSRRGPCGNLDPLLSCGRWPFLVKPETYLSSLMGILLLNALTAVLIYFSLAKAVPLPFVIVLAAITAIGNLTYFFTTFLNPGIVEDKEGVTDRYCQLCDVYQKESQKHCRICDVCVDGLDHHCGYFGICIGRNNLPFFYGHLVSMFIWFLSAGGSTVAIYQGTLD